jgi:glutamate N-acetyltransferase/amino-acid N-acetyltransferase
MKAIPDGTVTSPKGFVAGAVEAGIKASGGPDLGLLFSPNFCMAAGMFTANRVKAAPVILSQQHIAKGRAQAIVANAGCANACTGDQGLDDAIEMAQLAANRLGVIRNDMLVASTGVIGERLSMERIREKLGEIELSKEGGHDLARAIMTTDTRPKEVAIAADGFTIGGIAKGSGMIHPTLGTMLAFLTTDAAVGSDFLKEALREAVDATFNMVTVDGDTSPNDTVFVLANGMAGSVKEGTEEAGVFQQALTVACAALARGIAADGEGATKLIEVTVEGARTLGDARAAARTVAGSPLVKAAVHGCDPNWGRVIAALGRSGCEMDELRIDLFLGKILIVEKGSVVPFDEEEASAAMADDKVPIRVCLNLGEHSGTAWGCDLSAEYVTINSEYTT